MRDLELAPGPHVDEEPFWRRRSWWRRSGISSLLIWAATGITVLSTLIAARGLGPIEYGELVLALALATLVGMLLDLTLDEAVVRLGYRSLAEDRLGDLRTMLRTALGIDVVVGVAVFAVIALGAPLLTVLGGGEVDAALVRLAGLGVLAATLDGTTTGVLLLAGRPELRGWAVLAVGLTRLVAVLAALELGGQSAVLIAYAAATAVGGVFQAVLAWRVGWRHWRGAGAGAGSTWVWMRRLTGFGIHTSLATTITGANVWLVPVLLGAVAGPKAVGVFSVAFFPVVLANVFSGPLRLNMFPEQVKLAAQSRDPLLRQSIGGYTRIALAIGVPAAVAGWFIVPWLVPAVLSSSFDDAVTPTRILLVAAVAQLAYGWAKTFPAAIGRPQIRTFVSVVEIVVTVSLLLALSEAAAEGAAAAVSISSLVLLVLWLSIAARVLSGRRASPERVKTPERAQAG
jgi:O-antigen/teichoic acid export membrane protein